MKSINRKLHLEIIRIIGLICIIYNHTGARGNSAYMFTDSSITFTVSLLSDILCRIGVPLFFMISGALLLQKEESWQDIYRKRVLRMIEVIILFIGIRYLYECFWVKTITFSIIDLVKAILCGNLFLPYWFLYMYLSVLLMLPLLKRMINNLTSEELKLMVILGLVFHALLPCISSILNWGFEISSMASINGYYLCLGYYLEHKLDKSLYTKRNVISALMIIVVSTVFSYWLVVRSRLEDGIIQDINAGLLAVILAASVFFIVKYMFDDCIKNDALQKWITTIGSCTFGVYLIEDYLRNGLAFIFDNLEPYISTLPACAVWLSIVFITGIIIVMVLKRIPVLKKLL